jgi:Protein of unknown function (DUF2384)
MIPGTGAAGPRGGGGAGGPVTLPRDGLREIVPFGRDRKPRRVPTKPIDPAILDDVSGFVDDAEDWFYLPNPAFEGRKPVELLGTAEEPRLRNRIEAAKLGLFS